MARGSRTRARRLGPSATGGTGSSTATRKWPPRSGTGSTSPRRAPTRTTPRSRSATAPSPFSRPRRSTHRSGTRCGASSRSCSSPRASERLRPRVAHWVAHYVDEVIETGRCEFVYDLACPVPAAVTLEWLGFPPGDWQAISEAFHDTAAYAKGSARVRAGERRVRAVAHEDHRGGRRPTSRAT